MYYAVESNRPEVVKLLITFGAQSQIGINSDFGMNPLKLAEQQGFDEIITTLKAASNCVVQSLPTTGIIHTRFPFYPVQLIRESHDGKRKIHNALQTDMPLNKKRCVQIVNFKHV